MKSYVFRVDLVHEDDGRWSAIVPALPGCAVWGYTADEALEAIDEATKMYVEVLIEDGESVPLDEFKSGSEGPAVLVLADRPLAKSQ
jgi:predicted RNase H-like HicB family nuclease